MNFFKTTLLSLVLLGISLTAQAQSDESAVRATAMDYVDGTANGNLDQIRRAFHPDAALYGVNGDGTLRRIPINDYIGFFKPGERTGREGKIISIDVVNDAAHVKIEILAGPWKFTDYLLLLKLNGEWKIINKSYTRVKR